MKKLVLGGILALAGCMGTAKIFYQDGTGGVLTLDGDEGKAMEDAQAKMANHCGPRGYHIVKRETVVVGQESYSNRDRQYGENNDRAGVSQTTSGYEQSGSHGEGGSAYVTPTSAHENSGGYQESSGSAQTTTAEAEASRTRGHENEQSVSGTRQVTEQRVTYACGTAAAGAAAPAAQ